MTEDFSVEANSIGALFYKIIGLSNGGFVLLFAMEHPLLIGLRIHQTHTSLREYIAHME